MASCDLMLVVATLLHMLGLMPVLTGCVHYKMYLEPDIWVSGHLDNWMSGYLHICMLEQQIAPQPQCGVGEALIMILRMIWILRA